MHSSSTVEATSANMKPISKVETPFDCASPTKNMQVEVINVETSNDSENETQAFPDERISDVRNPRLSSYKVSTPAIRESEQKSVNLSTLGQESYVSTKSANDSRLLDEQINPNTDDKLQNNETPSTQKGEDLDFLIPNTIKVDLKASQNSDLISEITVFADQSSRLINE